MFKVYFELGLNHIAHFSKIFRLRSFFENLALDHILFIVALAAVYKLIEWKKVLILVTAFTIGHSITLALSALNIVTVNSNVVEFLIPVTIFITALYNIIFVRESRIIRVRSWSKVVSVKYFIALFFGLIHGMGFSNYFKSLLGQEAKISLPLFAFNVGIEVAQIIVVSVILLFAFIFMDVFKLKQNYWIWAVSAIALIMSIKMMVETWVW